MQARRPRSLVGRIAAILAAIALAVFLALGGIWLWHRSDAFGQGMLSGIVIGLLARWLVARLREK